MTRHHRPPSPSQLGSAPPRPPAPPAALSYWPAPAFPRPRHRPRFLWKSRDRWPSRAWRPAPRRQRALAAARAPASGSAGPGPRPRPSMEELCGVGAPAPLGRDAEEPKQVTAGEGGATCDAALPVLPRSGGGQSSPAVSPRLRLRGVAVPAAEGGSPRLTGCPGG